MRLIFVLSLLIVLMPGEGRAQQQCTSLDPTDAVSIFNCMSNLNFNGSPTTRFLEPWKGCEAVLKSIKKHVLDLKDADYQAPITCDTLAEVIRLHTGEPPYWAPCTITQETISTSEHMEACLLSYGKAKPAQAIEKLDSCRAVFAVYQEAIEKAIDRDWYFAPGAEIRQEGRRVWGTRDGFTFERTRTGGFSGLGDTLGQFNLGNSKVPYPQAPIRCSAAAEILAKHNANPEWAACTGYVHEERATHVQECLGTELAKLDDCQAIRREYEIRLKNAYGGVFPDGYRPMSCDVLAPVLEAKAEAEAQAARERAERQARAAEQRRQAAAQQSAEASGWIGGIVLVLGLIGAGGFVLYKWNERGIDFSYEEKEGVTTLSWNDTLSIDNNPLYKFIPAVGLVIFIVGGFNVLIAKDYENMFIWMIIPMILIMGVPIFLGQAMPFIYQRKQIAVGPDYLEYEGQKWKLSAISTIQYGPRGEWDSSEPDKKHMTQIRVWFDDVDHLVVSENNWVRSANHKIHRAIEDLIRAGQAKQMEEIQERDRRERAAVRAVKKETQGGDFDLPDV